MTIAARWVLVIVVVLVGGIVLWSVQSRSSCTLGYAGSAATLTVTGQNAADYCSREIARSGSAYATPERSNDVLICRYPLAGGLTFTVRDQGTFYLVGSDMCAKFKLAYEFDRATRSGAP